MPVPKSNIGSWLIDFPQTLLIPAHRRLKKLSLTALRSTPPLIQRPACLHVVAIVSILAYVFIYVNLPMFLLPVAGHDDGLYISHAHSIASGHWLGPYNQFTLMKGPGYPLFLVLISMTGVPLALAHSVLYCLAVWVLSYATNKVFNSIFLSITVLEVLLWHFGPHSMRVVRDAISTPQILIVFSLLILAFFVLKGTGTLLMSASIAGFTFGWFWITREDGLIAIPAILVLFACGFHRTYSARRSVMPFLKVLAAFMLSCVAVLAVIALINLKVYNTFTIVDIKGSFEHAFEALESVKPDVYVPYEAVSRSSREKIYKVSPTFAQLRPLIDGPGSPIQNWKQPGCNYYPAVCGDYATGWFLWALRDAVALHGDYSSPRAAMTFYTKVHDEVANACDWKIISCYHNVLPFMPHVNEAQLLHTVASTESALEELSLETPSLLHEINSMGTQDQIRDAAHFLNIKNYTPLQPGSSTTARRLVDFAINIRSSIVNWYATFLPMLLFVGFCSALILAIRCLYSRRYSVGFAIAFAAWVAVVCRLAALVLIDISSFPAIIPMYISYAYPLSCYASLISIFLVVRWLSFPEQPQVD